MADTLCPSRIYYLFDAKQNTVGVGWRIKRLGGLRCFDGDEEVCVYAVHAPVKWGRSAVGRLDERRPTRRGFWLVVLFFTPRVNTTDCSDSCQQQKSRIMLKKKWKINFKINASPVSVCIIR